MRKIISVAIIVLVLIGYVCMVYFTREDVTFDVTKTERVVDKDSSKYLIYTKNETFENTDTIWYLKFNSSDIYGKIKNDKKYSATVYGFRIQFLSMYRNIIDIKEIR